MSAQIDVLLRCITDAFPVFGRSLRNGLGDPIEHVEPPYTIKEIEHLEAQLSVPLPASYRKLIQCSRGFWLKGGAIQFLGDPFFHPAPPSEGMLCFAEYWLEADGDQLLFDVQFGLQQGEYPVFYYDHDWRPARIIKLADSLGEFLAMPFLEFGSLEDFPSS